MSDGISDSREILDRSSDLRGEPTLFNGHLGKLVSGHRAPLPIAFNHVCKRSLDTRERVQDCRVGGDVDEVEERGAVLLHRI